MCEEQPERARDVYNDVSKYMETIMSVRLAQSRVLSGLN
jgi:hypothetical protein